MEFKVTFSKNYLYENAYNGIKTEGQKWKNFISIFLEQDILNSRLIQTDYEIVGLDIINDYYDLRVKYGRLDNCGIHIQNIKHNVMIKVLSIKTFVSSNWIYLIKKIYTNYLRMRNLMLL